MGLNFSQIKTAKAELLQDLRTRTANFLQFFGYRKSQMALAVGISETHLGDYLNGSRGLSETTYAKIEEILTLPEEKRKILFPRNRIVNAQRFGQPVADQEIAIDAEREQFNDEHTNQIRLSGKNKNATSMFAGPEDTRKNLSI